MVTPKEGDYLAKPSKQGGHITYDLKWAIINAFEQLGGTDWLMAQAIENPVAFMGLLAKILPKQVDVSAQDGLKINVIIDKSGGNDV